MKLLLTVKQMNLNKKQLIATEISRTLVYIINRTKDQSEDENKTKLNKMARYLVKEWKKVVGLIEKS